MRREGFVASAIATAESSGSLQQGEAPWKYHWLVQPAGNLLRIIVELQRLGKSAAVPFEVGGWGEATFVRPLTMYMYMYMYMYICMYMYM